MHDNKDIEEIEGVLVNTKTNIVQNNTKPVQERHYYHSQLKKDVKCYDEDKGKYINVHL